MIHLAIIAALYLHIPTQSVADKSSTECVILLHGLGRTASSMKRMEEGLSSGGYLVANIGYDSRSGPIRELAEKAIPQGLEKCREGDAGTIHFVTHSLGGILLRAFLEKNTIKELGRSVMLAPPNQGSAAVDVYRRIPGFGLVNGDAGFELGTDDKSVPLSLGPVSFDVGIIAGDRTIDPLTSKMLANPDDGKVSVTDTKVEGMNDFLLVHRSHAFIMKAKDVIWQTKHYLTHGQFDHADKTDEVEGN
ncbi:MAG: alpha/beta hydrolase [Gammaproteobacteria bacterium]|nr:alpha/beta hydrolase [Gammaproteobacteria bacterium]